MSVVQACPLRNKIDSYGYAISTHLEQGVIGFVDAITPVAFQQVDIALRYAVLIHAVIERKVDFTVEPMAKFYRIENSVE